MSLRSILSDFPLSDFFRSLCGRIAKFSQISAKRKIHKNFRRSSRRDTIGNQMSLRSILSDFPLSDFFRSLCGRIAKSVFPKLPVNEFTSYVLWLQFELLRRFPLRLFSSEGMN